MNELIRLFLKPQMFGEFFVCFVFFGKMLMAGERKELESLLPRGKGKERRYHLRENNTEGTHWGKPSVF